MNREILFRGKRVDNGEWVEGDLIHTVVNFNPSIHIIHWKGNSDNEHSSEVITSTIGQFTGLTDKNGVKIWEGDIVKDTTDEHMVIGWSKRFASYIIDRDGWAFSHWFGESMEAHEVKVIGNIHNNPELIK